ncbi:universal stress protein [Amylibacter sp. SFDW26]|uniref:universal stress protein n=1 Tax=Amylibacter sp. SFDW26 TaxID=2652722 RepID=UPI001261F1F9|nr:universal stress protein [Amylibacter sp. SFDW26]KAB7613408.1 universal stress protein [Amylibacter sp. SFDW26]
MFKKIVVGLDGSDPSENALRVACDLGKKYKSEIHLVHTPEPETVVVVGATTGYATVAASPRQEEMDEAGKAVLKNGEEIAGSAGCKKVETHLTHGNTADQILHCAEDCGADLIITGRRGLGAVGSLVLGSTSQRVSHLATCACLSVA